jgi:uncharacterized tellurite resistance protein B-like protein
MLEKLDRTMRLRLLRVLAAAAWVDGEVQDSERAFLSKVLSKLPIDEADKATAMGYLDTPPHPAEVDPTKIPQEHREALVKLVWQLIGSDGQIGEQETQAVKDLEELLLP